MATTMKYVYAVLIYINISKQQIQNCFKRFVDFCSLQFGCETKIKLLLDYKINKHLLYWYLNTIKDVSLTFSLKLFKCWKYLKTFVFTLGDCFLPYVYRSNIAECHVFWMQ